MDEYVGYNLKMGHYVIAVPVNICIWLVEPNLRLILYVSNNTNLL